MSRIMGDAIGVNAASIPRSVSLVAGYITGLGDVPWSLADWALFPGKERVTIDQGAGASPRYDANVMDIETGAFSVSSVPGWMNRATAPRPTIYVNRGNEFAAANAALTVRKTIDVWLAFPGWTEGQPLPPLPVGAKYVAVQDLFGANAGVDYDLSTVIDDTWPNGGTMSLTAYKSATVTYDNIGIMHLVGVGQDNRVYISDSDGKGGWTNTRPVTDPLTFV